jgi:hypothetical protein
MPEPAKTGMARRSTRYFSDDQESRAVGHILFACRPGRRRNSLLGQTLALAVDRRMRFRAIAGADPCELVTPMDDAEFASRAPAGKRASEDAINLVAQIVRPRTTGSGPQRLTAEIGRGDTLATVTI